MLPLKKPPSELGHLEVVKNDFDYADERIQAFESRPFSHRYVAGEVGLEVHIRIWSGCDNRDAKYFVARLRRIAWRPCDDLNIMLVGGKNWKAVRPRRRRLQRERITKSARELQGPVLIGVREFRNLSKGMQNPESWRNECAPGRNIDLFSSSPAEWLEFAELDGVAQTHVFPMPMLPPSPFVRVNGELNAGGLGRRYASFVMTQSQLPREIVESRSEVVNRIPRDQAPVVADLYGSLDAVDEGSAIGAPLFWLELFYEGDGMRFISNLPQNANSKRVDVHFGMINLSPTIA